MSQEVLPHIIQQVKLLQKMGLQVKKGEKERDSENLEISQNNIVPNKSTKTDISKAKCIPMYCLRVYGMEQFHMGVAITTRSTVLMNSAASSTGANLSSSAYPTQYYGCVVCHQNNQAIMNRDTFKDQDPVGSVNFWPAGFGILCLPN